MWYTIFLLLYWIFFLPRDAYAYLDPASGNAVVSFFIAIVGAFIYSIKSIFYKVFSINRPSKNNSLFSKKAMDKRPVLFSEGRDYWTTFRPIVEEFIKQKKYFKYISLDVHDPALTIDSEYMDSKRVPRNKYGFAKIAKIQAPIMLSTTPNIGSPGYPLQRPVGVKKLVHIFHAMVDVSCYRKGSLDFYDTVLMTGEHEEKPIRIVESARNIKRKELIVAGLPCLDDLYRQKQECIEKDKSNSTMTVLVAPSWGAKGCFTEYGIDFIHTLSDAGFNIIIRLHPHSYIFEPQSVVRWKQATSTLTNVVWDSNSSGTEAMNSADILVSDASSIRFDFAFIYNKPVITLHIPKGSREMFEGCYMEETWADTVSDHIGKVIHKDDIGKLGELIQTTLKDVTKDAMIALRDKTVANFGKSAPTIVNHLTNQARLLSMSTEERHFRSEINEIQKEITELRLQIKKLVVANKETQ